MKKIAIELNFVVGTLTIMQWKCINIQDLKLKELFLKNGAIKASYKDMDENDIYKYTYFLTKEMFLERLFELEKDNQNKLK